MPATVSEPIKAVITEAVKAAATEPAAAETANRVEAAASRNSASDALQRQLAAALRTARSERETFAKERERFKGLQSALTADLSSHQERAKSLETALMNERSALKREQKRSADLERKLEAAVGTAETAHAAAKEERTAAEMAAISKVIANRNSGSPSPESEAEQPSTYRLPKRIVTTPTKARSISPPVGKAAASPVSSPLASPSGGRSRHSFVNGERVLASTPEGGWSPGRVLSKRTQDSGSRVQYKVSLDGYDSENHEWLDDDDPRVKKYASGACGDGADDAEGDGEALERKAARILNEEKRARARAMLAAH